MADLTLRAAAAGDGDAVRELVHAVLEEHGLRPDPAGADADLGDLDGHYWRRGGAFWVLVDDGGAVLGSCALARVDGETAELRKMYLHPALRGQGWGSRLLEHALAAAEAAGFRRVQLETASVLQAAIALYRRRGFRPLPRAPDTARCDQMWVLELGADR